MCCNRLPCLFQHDTVYEVNHLYFFYPLNTQMTCKGSLGARINELKQRVIAENPHRFAVAVPRELPNIYTHWQYLSMNQHHIQANSSFVFPQIPLDPRSLMRRRVWSTTLSPNSSLMQMLWTTSMLALCCFCVSIHDLPPAELKVVLFLSKVYRAWGIQGEPVRHKYRGYPLCTGQE